MSSTRSAGTCRWPFSQRLHMAGVTPSSDATASVAHFSLARQFLSALVMPHSFHIGNRVSSAKVSNPGIRPFPNGNYNVSMIDRIGSKRPSRLYIREWIKKRSLDQKRIAERMNCEEKFPLRKLLTF